MTQKIILVTGASSGLGRAIAQQLSCAGHIVFGTSRHIGDTDYCQMLQMDVTQSASVAAGVTHIIDTCGRIDVVINNAGMGIGGAAELATDDEIRLQMQTNFGGTVNVCRCVLPHMRRQHSGHIINISSIGGRFGIPYQGLYSASKFAIEGYSEALSLEIAQFGINVTIVEPGDFCTGFTAGRHISTATLHNDDYRQSFQRVLRNIENDEQHGGQPVYLARRITKIVAAKRPKLRYVVTPNVLQKISVLLSHWMYGRHFQALLRRFYRV
ncbi:MAG: SDR family oxidoreductase [Paludibacteraceae bacterium]